MLQRQGLQIASKNLDFNVLAVFETFDGLAANAQRELQKQESLLTGVDADLELISKVAVHVEFCSEAVRTAIEAGDPQRVLGDYVSKQKMQTVKDSCAKTHGGLPSPSVAFCSLKTA
jgi:autophagy-related protein 11